MSNHEENVLDYLEDAKPGQVIRFWYEGGSSPGYRTVEVTEVNKDAERVTGKTRERDNNIRSYSSVYASEISVVHEQHNHPVDGVLRVRFDEAGEKLLASLPANKLAELYAQYVAVEENEGVHFDESSGEVVVKLVDKTPKLAPYYDGEFRNDVLVFKRGEKRFSIHNYKSENTFGIHNEISGFDSAGVHDPNVLLRELQAFLA